MKKPLVLIRGLGTLPLVRCAKHSRCAESRARTEPSVRISSHQSQKEGFGSVGLRDFGV